MSQEPSKGFVVVASYSEKFYPVAINLIETILDYYPEARVTLFTEERFVDQRAYDICEHVMFCPDHYRAKLYGMANSPYDITAYLDADTVCEHEDISTMFDLLGDNDLMFTPLNKENEYCFESRYFNPKDPDEYRSMKLCGGVCLYNNANPLVKEFMNDWWEYYQKQRTGEWWPLNENGEKDFVNFKWENRFWDQFTLWWLTNEVPKYKDIKVELLDLRWNWYNRFVTTKTQIDKPVVIRHYSGGVDKWD